MNTHLPVMLREAIAALDVQPDGVYLDGTFGRGGHSAEIVKLLSANGRLFAIDKDEQAIAHAREQYGNDERFTITQASFADLGSIAQAWEITGKVNGILLDLGVSSPQLDDAGRGFSFKQDGPLDMRMNTSQGQSAAQWIATVTEAELSRVIKEFGEEKFARRIARAICEARQQTPFTRTKQLAEVVAKAHPRWEKGKDPATRTFQAIRIFINNELDDLKQFLDHVLDVLAVGGRLAIISFHSLEDRIVKQWIQHWVKYDPYPPGLPVANVHIHSRLKALGKMQQAGEAELDVNVRARSARLRVAEKLA